MKMSEHFTLNELTFSATAHAIGLNNTPPPEIFANMQNYLVPGAERARVILLNNAIIVSSGFRSKELNRLIPGSSDTSAHTLGYAIDFTCPGFGNPYQVCVALAESDLVFDQIIYESALDRYQNLTIWCHASFDPRARRMTLTKKPGQDYIPGLIL